MIELVAGALTALIDPTLGAEICQVTHRGRDLLAYGQWEPPPDPDPSTSATAGLRPGTSQFEWLRQYRGGWQLLVPNAGRECVWHDTPLPFHGQWSRTTVDVVDRGPAHVSVCATIGPAYEVTRTITVYPHPARLTVHTSIVNVSADAAPFVWVEHPVFPVEPGDRIDLPAHRVVSQAGTELIWPADPDGSRDLRVVPAYRPHESVHYLPDVVGGWAAVRGRHGGVALCWDTRAMPHAWLWTELGSPGFPFYGGTSMVAVEPASVWPGDGLRDAVDRGTATWLEPGHAAAAQLTMIPFDAHDGAPDRAVCGAHHDGTITFSHPEDHR